MDSSQECTVSILTVHPSLQVENGFLTGVHFCGEPPCCHRRSPSKPCHPAVSLLHSSPPQHIPPSTTPPALLSSPHGSCIAPAVVLSTLALHAWILHPHPVPHPDLRRIGRSSENIDCHSKLRLRQSHSFRCHLSNPLVLAWNGRYRCKMVKMVELCCCSCEQEATDKDVM